jgi:hypothetical protein
MNHVFVDFENVQKIDLALIGTKAVRFTLLLGAKQTKLDVELVEKLMEHAASVELIRLTASGKNALDFALSYYLGRKTLADPTAYFHVISKDKGYEPLIDHLRSRHIRVRRHDDISTLTFSHRPKEAPPGKITEPAGTDDLLKQVVERLRKNVANRPKKTATLLSHLKSLLGKNATEAAASDLLKRLQKAGHLTIGEKNAVSYHLETLQTQSLPD